MTNAAELDFGGHENSGTGTHTIDDVRRLSIELLSAQLQVAQAEAKLEEAKAAEARLAEEVLPEVMKSAGVPKLDIDTAGGSTLTIELTDVEKGGILKERAAEAHKWMDENNYGALVKRFFTIKFNRGDDAWARKFERDCRQRKKPLNIERVQKVEANTADKFVRDRVKEGVVLPECFRYFKKPVVKVTRPKGK